MSPRMRPLRSCALAVVLVTPGALLAQTRSASDVTGGSVTSGALLGGSFVPGTGLRPVPVGTNLYDPAALERIRSAATALENQVNRGALTGPEGEAIEPAAQLAVLGVLKSATTGAGLSVAALRDVLGRGVPRSAVLAAVLVDAMIDMGATPAPVQVAVATRALNAFVAAADASFLAAPPAEFVAAYAIIQRYSAAATQAAPPPPTRAATP